MIIAIVIRRDTTHRTQPPFNCFNELWIASRVANRDGTSYLPRTASSGQSRSLINDLNEFTHSINATSSMGISLSLSLGRVWSSACGNNESRVGGGDSAVCKCVGNHLTTMMKFWRSRTAEMITQSEVELKL